MSGMKSFETLEDAQVAAGHEFGDKTIDKGDF